MLNCSHCHSSIWQKSARIPDFPSLPQLGVVDNLVVGSGIAGLSTTYHLAKEGARVVVVSDSPLGGAMSVQTSGHLSAWLDDGMSRYVKIFGKEKAALAYESHQSAIQKIEKICREESIDCGFRTVKGYLCATKSDELDFLEAEWKAYQSLGVELKRSIWKYPGSAHEMPVIEFSDLGEIHILQYLNGLYDACIKMGVEFFTAHVTKVHSGLTPSLETRHGISLQAKNLILCTNSPIYGQLIHTRQAPYTSYVMAFEIPKGSASHFLFWDCQDPYHYVRVLANDDEISSYDFLIVGGEDHKTGQEIHGDEHYKKLEIWAREFFPECGDVHARWSGQVLETLDGLANIGLAAQKENIYIATGDSGMGLTHGTIAGEILSELVLTGSHPWEKIFSPSRQPLQTMPHYLKENLNVAKQYFDWVAPGDRSTDDSLSFNSGAVIQDGTAKIAIYKDSHGFVHRFSAACPHMGCVVKWNENEKTFDCPCHGSRFDCMGQVLMGPSLDDLHPAPLPPQSTEYERSTVEPVSL